MGPSSSFTACMLRVRGMSVAVVTAALLVLVAALDAAAAPGRERPSRPERVPGSYIVVYRPSVDDPGRKTDRLERSKGFRASHRYANALKGFAARLSDRQVRELREDPDVDFVSPDRPVQALGTVPLKSGERVPTGVRRMEAGTTALIRGASTVNVAVVDTGVDLDHPDLNVVHGKTCNGSGLAEDLNGHGTHVAGTIGARNDGAGLVGVAPGTRLAAVRVLDGDGEGTWSQVICGIDWATATRSDGDAANDISVANLSLGGLGTSVRSCSTTTDALHKAICRSTAAGVHYVVAAGNSGWDFDFSLLPDVPAAYPQVLTVTAMADSDGKPGGAGGAPSCMSEQADDRYASFSNFAGTSAGQAHTIAGPGVCIESTVPNGYGVASGTSMATPHLAGAVALCLGDAAGGAPCAGLTPAQVIAEIRADAESHTRAVPSFGFAGDPLRPVSGRYYGYLSWGGVESASTTTTAHPSAAVVGSGWGSLRGGDHADLVSDDDSYFQVDSTQSGELKTGWAGIFLGVPNELTSLEVRYKGKNSLACTQYVAVWSWKANDWVILDSRNVGTSEVLVESTAGGTLADYVSGTSGGGEVRVAVACFHGSATFSASGDLLEIEYASP